MFNRLINIELPEKQSAFVWGARKVGKSTYLKAHFPNSVYYDLLKTDLFLQLAKEPYLFREEIIALTQTDISYPIIVDEVQKIPALLDEIHWLIENTPASFILCGSSARKLKRGAANLLGGRAWRYHFYPLVYPEIPDFDLLRAFNHGLIPSHYLSTQPKKSLRAYVTDYLKEEIQSEGLVRNLPNFARFLDSLPYCHAELINYSNIARDCGIDAKTVKEYFQILIDTLLGYSIHSYSHKGKRQEIIATPKFYLFDMGVFHFLAGYEISELSGDRAGKALEHFILTELMAYRGLKDLDFAISYWRAKSGLEVDFILGRGEIAIEVKISPTPRLSDVRGLQAFIDDYQPKKSYVICTAERARVHIINDHSQMEFIPWQQFLEKLWAGEII